MKRQQVPYPRHLDHLLNDGRGYPVIATIGRDEDSADFAHTPTSAAGAASGCVKAARSWTSSAWTGAPSPARSAGGRPAPVRRRPALRRIPARGPSGQVVAFPAPAPGAGRPRQRALIDRAWRSARPARRAHRVTKAMSAKPANQHTTRQSRSPAQLLDGERARRRCAYSSAASAQPPRSCPGAVRIPTAGTPNVLRPSRSAPARTGSMTGVSTGR
jgi:hypothetical protein